MSDRTRLPNRRPCEVRDFIHAGIAYRGAVSRYPDGTIAEVFLDATSVKSTAPVQHFAHALAIAASIALHHGASVDEIRHGLPKVDLPNGGSEAADPIGRLLELIGQIP